MASSGTPAVRSILAWAAAAAGENRQSELRWYRDAPPRAEWQLARAADFVFQDRGFYDDRM
jgi:hypothetical protein